MKRKNVSPRDKAKLLLSIVAFCAQVALLILDLKDSAAQKKQQL